MQSLSSGEFPLHNFERTPLAALPPPLVGMRRVTEEVAQMVVNTLLAPGNWQLAIGQNQNREFNRKGHEGTQRKSGTEPEPCDFADRTRLAPRAFVKTDP